MSIKISHMSSDPWMISKFEYILKNQQFFKFWNFMALCKKTVKFVKECKRINFITKYCDRIEIYQFIQYIL